MLEDSHPLLPLILRDPDNAKVNVINFHLAKFAKEELPQELVCGICDEHLPENDPQRGRKYNDSTALVKHVISCQNTHCSEDFMRCNFCGSMVRRTIPDSCSKDDARQMGESVDHALNKHLAVWYQDYLESL